MQFKSEPKDATLGAFHGILKRKSYSYVCAIDFGTSGTGFCYAVPKKGKIDAKRDIIRNPDWPGNQGRGKTSTSIILDEKINAYLKFGTDARNAAPEYAMLQKGRYFEYFKMQLYNHRGNMPFMIKDAAGDNIDALIVFKESLRFIKNAFFDHLKKKNADCSEKDVLWVLTVPAIWNDGAKLLMRQAAVAAGLEMEDGQLMLALEPEAASLWCLASGGVSLKKNDVYMVVDCGGGTVDVTVHHVERVDARHPLVKEVVPASGGNWGSTSIDRSVLNLFKEVFGTTRYDRLQQDPLGMPQLLETIEKAKCAFDGDISPVMQLPDALTQMSAEDSETANQAVLAYNLKNKTTLLLRGSNIMIPAAFFSEFISETVDNITSHVREKLNKTPGIKYVVMVGNFANCIPLQRQMEIELSSTNAKLIIPDEPGDAIMKGAVIYGVDSSSVLSRRSRKTYGMTMHMPFIDGVHPANRLEVISGKRYCKDVFRVFVKKYEEIPSGRIVELTHYRLYPGQVIAAVNILSTEEEEPPEFADHPSVISSAKHKIEIPNIGSGCIVTGMLFGDTEVRCRSVNEHGNEVVTTMELL